MLQLLSFVQLLETVYLPTERQINSKGALDKNVPEIKADYKLFTK